jgi:hypothetical protein
MFNKFDAFIDDLDTIRLCLVCNWCSSKELVAVYSKMSQDNRGRWNNIQIVPLDDNSADYYVVLNAAELNIRIDPGKVFVFQMEPNMAQQPEVWGFWAKPERVRLFDHKTVYNNVEWHLSLTYSQLMHNEIKKDSSLNTNLSTVLSAKCGDPGHKLRLEFARFLDQKVPQLLHVFGTNLGYNNYKGSLPYHCKDNGLLPYKYTFNAENNSIHNYFTEKLVDGILAECLVFYWGCPNVADYIDERAFVYINLEDKGGAAKTIERAINEDWWSQRILYIRAAKRKILNELQFFPRMERIIKSI